MFSYLENDDLVMVRMANGELRAIEAVERPDDQQFDEVIMHVLDGLLYHESDLRIAEHYTDTAGFTDHVFALCHLLGFRFAPRMISLL